MAIRPSTLPFPLVKSLAKGLSRAGKEGKKLSSLSASQEALAQAMKYEDWERLVRSYDTLSSMPAIKPLEAYLNRVLDLGDHRLVMNVSSQRTSFSMENHIGTVYLGDEEYETGMIIAKVFFNVLDESPEKVVVFSPDRPQKGFTRIGMTRGEVHLEACCLPAGEEGFTVTFTPVEVGRGVFLPRFFPSKGIASLFHLALNASPAILETESDLEACVLMESLTTLATPLRPVMVLASQFLPRLPASSPARIIRLEGQPEGLGEALDHLPPLFPKTLLIVDARGQDPKTIGRRAKQLGSRYILIAKKETAEDFRSALGLSADTVESVEFHGIGGESSKKEVSCD